MNEYIINPSWFYWISVASAVKIGAVIVGFLALVILFICLIDYSFNKDMIGFGAKYKAECESDKKVGKIMAIVCGVMLIIAILVPSRETLIQMKLAELGTYDNANKAIEMIQDATDYILDHIKGE